MQHAKPIPDCDEVTALLARPALGGEDQGRLEEHLRECPACAEVAALTLDEPIGPGDELVEVGALLQVDPRCYLRGRELGRGGMGRTVEAWDRRLRRTVAIKELLDERLRERFEREARLTARLQHPNIVRVHERGVWPDGVAFYAMDRVPGRPLEALIAERPTLPERLALLPNVLAAAEAMAYAHGQRIVHRDLKPANLLVGAFGETVIIDWGLAKDLAEEHEIATPLHTPVDALTADGAGTAQYMPPEQAEGIAPHERFDVYALGATLYHLLAGRAPYAEMPPQRRKLALLSGPPAPLAQLAPGLPAALQAIVAKAMARMPADRYPSAKELADELARFQTGRLVQAHTYSRLERALRFARRHRAVLGVAALALCLVLFLAAEAAVAVVRERDAAELGHAQARASLSQLLEEKARQELLSGSQLRALAYLGAAAEGGHPAAFLQAAALRTLDAQKHKLEGHRDSLVDASFSSDGERILSASLDGTARLWSARSGQLLAVLADHRSDLSSAAFSSDGALALTASVDGTAKIWDGRSGALLRTLRGHTGALLQAGFVPGDERVVTSGFDQGVRIWDPLTGEQTARLDTAPLRLERPLYFAFSPDRRALVTSGDDARLAFWDVRTGKLLLGQRQPLAPGGVSIFSVAWSPGGAFLAAGTRDGPVHLVDARTGALVRTMTEYGGTASRLFFTNDGSKLLAAGAATPQVWDGRTGAHLFALEGHRGPVLFADASPDGKLFVTAGEDGTSRLFSADEGRLLAVYEGHEKRVRTARFSPDGVYIVTASEDATARIWDTRVRSLVASLDGHTAAVKAAAFSPNGELLVTGSWDGTARLWAAQGGAPRGTLRGHGDRVGAALFTTGGARVLTASWDGTARLWSAASGSELVKTSPAHGRLWTAAASPDGARFVVAGEEHVAFLHDASGAQIAALAGHRDAIASVAFSPDGARIATASFDGTARLWDAARGALLAVLEGHGDSVRSVAFSPGGALLATGSDDHTGRVWSVETGALLSTLLGHSGSVTAVTFLDDERVVTAGAAGRARVFSARDGRLLQSLDGHASAVMGLAAAGGRVATISQDRTAGLWDAGTGRLFARLEGHTAAPTAVAFNPGMSRLATGDADGKVRLWDVHDETRSAESIAALVREEVPWHLAAGTLAYEPAPPRPDPPQRPFSSPELTICERTPSRCFELGLREQDKGASASDLATAALFGQACAAGNARACVRALPQHAVHAVLLGETADYVLWFDPLDGGAKALDPYGGPYEEGSVHLARIAQDAFDDKILGTASRAVSSYNTAALGLSGGELLAFCNSKRRSGTFQFDGLLWRLDPRTLRGTREVLFADWNAGFAARFEQGELLHYTFSEYSLIRGAHLERPASWHDVRERWGRDELSRVGLPYTEALVDVAPPVQYGAILRRWGGP